MQYHLFSYFMLIAYHIKPRSRYDRMIVEITTTCAISAYHHYRCDFQSRSWRGVLDTTLCDKVCH